jgi:hypothetical protein
VLDEIERLVPGYALDRLNLLGGNDVRTEPGFVPVTIDGKLPVLGAIVPRTTDCLPPERWAATARRSRNLNSTRHTKLAGGSAPISNFEVGSEFLKQRKQTCRSSTRVNSGL